MVATRQSNRRSGLTPYIFLGRRESQIKNEKRWSSPFLVVEQLNRYIWFMRVVELTHSYLAHRLRIVNWQPSRTVRRLIRSTPVRWV